MPKESSLAAENKTAMEAHGKYLLAAALFALLSASLLGGYSQYSYSTGRSIDGIKCGRVAELSMEEVRFSGESEPMEILAESPLARQAAYRYLKFSEDAGIPACGTVVTVKYG